MGILLGIGMLVLLVWIYIAICRLYKKVAIAAGCSEGTASLAYIPIAQQWLIGKASGLKGGGGLALLSVVVGGLGGIIIRGQSQGAIIAAIILYLFALCIDIIIYHNLCKNFGYSGWTVIALCIPLVNLLVIYDMGTRKYVGEAIDW
jgi:hypothetical protein